MKRLPVVALGILLLSSLALAQDKPAKPAADKALTVTGVVAAVTADSLTVKGKAAEWTFTVDKDTHVSGVGASRKTAALKNDKKPAVITEYVKVGDTVNVRYTEKGTAKTAVAVVIRSSLPGKK